MSPENNFVLIWRYIKGVFDLLNPFSKSHKSSD